MTVLTPAVCFGARGSYFVSWHLEQVNSSMPVVSVEQSGCRMIAEDTQSCAHSAGGSTGSVGVWPVSPVESPGFCVWPASPVESPGVCVWPASPVDRRFHLEAEYNDEIAAQVIKGYMEEIPEFYISTNKGVLTGFLGLKESEEEKNAAIYLAAVDERYRISGAALSLYASALFDGAVKGFKNITGYISTANPSVINLYAYFGGVFSNPQDIYIKKIEGRK